MVKISSFLVLIAIVIVGAQIGHHGYSQEQVSTTHDHNNPWANYYQPKQSLRPRNEILNRQSILNNPEALAIAGVAVGGLVGLSGLSLGLADANTQRQQIRRDLLNTFDEPFGTCSSDQLIVSRLNVVTELLEVIFKTFGFFERFQSVEPRLEEGEILAAVNSIRQPLPTIDCNAK